jgi:hypothetical protein
VGPKNRYAIIIANTITIMITTIITLCFKDHVEGFRTQVIRFKGCVTILYRKLFNRERPGDDDDDG